MTEHEWAIHGAMSAISTSCVVTSPEERAYWIVESRRRMGLSDGEVSQEWASLYVRTVRAMRRRPLL